MNKMNTTSRLLALLLAALMVLSLAACGTKSGDKKDFRATSGYFFSIMVSLLSMSRIFSASP